MADPNPSASGFFEWLASASGQIAISGALGGLVKSITLRERWFEGLGSLIVGCFCALYISPLAIPVIEPVIGSIMSQKGQVSTFAGFVTGIGGMALVGLIFDIIAARRRSLQESRGNK